MSHFAISIDVSLLVDPPYALQGANIERVLTAEITRMGRFDPAASLIIQLLLFQRLQRPRKDSYFVLVETSSNWSDATLSLVGCTGARFAEYRHFFPSDVCRRSPVCVVSLRMGCRAARTSSSRRTGVLVGASRNNSGSVSAANIGPNLFHQKRTVSWLISILRSCSRSSTFRSDKGNRT